MLENFRTDENGWVWLPIEWVLRHLEEAGDFGLISDYDSDLHFWATIIQSKAIDIGFLGMVDSLLTHGWKEALLMDVSYFEANPYLSISNGHHRLTAAILLCMDEVPMWNYGMNGRIRAAGCPT